MQLTRRSLLAASAFGLVNISGSLALAGQNSPKRIVFIAGGDSHGYGEHEHLAGCRLLADSLNAFGGIKAEVIGHWPVDESVFDNAGAVVIFADGADKQVIEGHKESMQKLVDSKIGIGIMHWALDPPKDQRRTVCDAIGGYFAQNWSINPMWTARINKIPKHPVTNGVKPFSIRDEWYYHMKFVAKEKNVTPLLSVLPPVETLIKRDGPYSNNAFVRKSVLRDKKPQHLAWVYRRPSGGRGFGFTGGHFHMNWANDDFRMLVLNAVAWLAGVKIPTKGIPSKTPGYEELFSPLGKSPESFNADQAKKQINEWKSVGN